MQYIPFTEEQKLLAASVDLPDFLERHQVELKRSGKEFRLVADPYITIRGNQWFDQAEQRGGNAVSFVQKYFDLSYPEAVMQLLDKTADDWDRKLEGMAGSADTCGSKADKVRKPFELPKAHTDMRRVFAYLIQQRKIPAWVVSHFAKAGILYESAVPSKDGLKEYHNAVFVGCDENGTARHAQMHGLASSGESWHGIIEGSEAAYSFHHTGTDNKLFVFEAPIDMLSFIVLHPEDWQQHSYVALCGLSEHALLHMLRQNSQFIDVVFCLDNDVRGIEGAERLERILDEHGDFHVETEMPTEKDWSLCLEVR